ncbi:phosphonatase-like hydrolase [Gordonia jinhuaensis]|uniref:Haloacid dehalogenase-like hydrolase n=1 Tax=Gordonia jinhuaensis TaxID=1517702 RepID=A0A916T5K8_9ACTN|nr:HAD family hydrolase [Gordonia jinhuaensis]GGB29492.1 putative haloacid dehalogenase-like hydrolase [Gordonia jinhuaensis]
MSDHIIRMAALDMAGTTVADDGLVLTAFDAAAKAAGLPDSGPEADAARQYVIDTMGQSKIVVFRALLNDDEDRAQQANSAFEAAYERNLGEVRPIDGAADAIERLRAADIKVVLTTGFSAGTRDRLLDVLGWTTIADLTLAPSDAGRGRPYPDMILAAALRLQIDDVREIAVLGDTANDVTAGLRSGASIVAGTLTGAHDADTLAAAGATDVVPDVSAFADLLLS